MASEQTMTSIASSLELLAKASVLSLIDGKARDDQMLLLDGLGFKPVEIAGLLSMKANTVSKALARLKMKRSEATE
jgi:hypothetical protein